MKPPEIRTFRLRHQPSMKSTIEKFYRAFGDLDADRMLECYHQDVVFEDPAFGKLEGEHACNMWRMLCQSQRGKDFQIHASNFEYADNKGSAHWEAYYIFSKTGRKVHNIIRASFEFKDGLIIHHKDDFNLKSWAKQALGLTGRLFGGTSGFKAKLQQQTRALLKEYERRTAE